MIRNFKLGMGLIALVCAFASFAPSLVQAQPRIPGYGPSNSCYIDPYRLTTYTTDGWYHVAGDAAQRCFSGVAQQGLFVQLWEYWQSKHRWIKEGEGPVSKGGANQTIFAGDEVGCGSHEERDWSMHARGFYQDYHGLWWIGTRYRTQELPCRN